MAATSFLKPLLPSNLCRRYLCFIKLNENYKCLILPPFPVIQKDIEKKTSIPLNTKSALGRST